MFLAPLLLSRLMCCLQYLTRLLLLLLRWQPLWLSRLRDARRLRRLPRLPKDRNMAGRHKAREGRAAQHGRRAQGTVTRPHHRRQEGHHAWRERNASNAAQQPRHAARRPRHAQAWRRRLQECW
jgi:hypothetical protein